MSRSTASSGPSPRRTRVPDTPPGPGVEEPDAGGTQQPDEPPSRSTSPSGSPSSAGSTSSPRRAPSCARKVRSHPRSASSASPGCAGHVDRVTGNNDDRAGGAHSARSHVEPAHPTDVSQPAPTTPHEPIFTSIAAVPPGPLPATQPDPSFDGHGVAGSDASTVEPQPMVEEQVGAWLNSYLVATGHAADDGPSEARVEDGTSDASVVDDPQTLSAPGPIARVGTAGAADPAPSAQTGAPAGLVGSDVLGRGAQDDPDTATEPEPLEESHHRSLAELAGLSPPEPRPDTWLPAVPPPPAAVAHEPPVDTVVTSIPEPGREPERNRRTAGPSRQLGSSRSRSQWCSCRSPTEPAAEVIRRTPGDRRPWTEHRTARPRRTTSPSFVRRSLDRAGGPSTTSRRTFGRPSPNLRRRSTTTEPDFVWLSSIRRRSPTSPSFDRRTRNRRRRTDDAPEDLRPARAPNPSEGEIDEPEPGHRSRRPRLSRRSRRRPRRPRSTSRPQTSPRPHTHRPCSPPRRLHDDRAPTLARAPEHRAARSRLSWREAESFDIGAARRRGRRRARDRRRSRPRSWWPSVAVPPRGSTHDSDLDVPRPSSTVPRSTRSQPPRRPTLRPRYAAPTARRPAAELPGRKGAVWIAARRSLVLVLLAAAAAWYFLLRDDGERLRPRAPGIRARRSRQSRLHRRCCRRGSRLV